MPTLPGIERPRQHQRRVSPWWLLTAALWLATPVWAQEPWTWAPIADLNQPRAEHTATLLANGTVLIAGGRDAAGQPGLGRDLRPRHGGLHAARLAVAGAGLGPHSELAQ